MKKQTWVSKVVAWSSFIRRQMSRAKVEDDKRGIDYLGYYVGNISNERI